VTRHQLDRAGDVPVGAQAANLELLPEEGGGERVIARGGPRLMLTMRFIVAE